MQPSEPRRRVVLATGVYQPEQGGASEWIRNYARWLTARGHEVIVGCERAEADDPGPGRLLTLPAARQTKNSWRRAADLQALIEGAAADVVHDTGCLLRSDVLHPLMGSLVHNWIRQLRTYPFALRLRRFWQVRLWRDVRLQWHQRRRHRVLVACSKRVAADFARLGCGDSVIIPNGIRIPSAAKPGEIQGLRARLGVGDRVLALVTATNFYLKGVMTVLRALPLLDEATRRKLLVVVAGHNRDSIFQREIDRLGIGACCRLEGWVKDIDPYYAAADIFLHPTYHDAGSLSTLKALAAGCAVVTSRFDGSADQIEPGVHGLVLREPGNPRELAEVLRHLMNADFRRQLGSAARGLTPAIGEERQFERLAELYECVPSGGLPRQAVSA